MSDDDLIRRGDALKAVDDAYDDSLEPDLADASTRIASLPAAPTFTAADLERTVTWQDLPPDGRPCHTDIFLAQAVDAIDDHYDFRDAVKHWLEGDWDGAMEYLNPPADLAQRVKE